MESSMTHCEQVDQGQRFDSHFFSFFVFWDNDRVDNYICLLLKYYCNGKYYYYHSNGAMHPKGIAMKLIKRGLIRKYSFKLEL